MQLLEQALPPPQPLEDDKTKGSRWSLIPLHWFVNIIFGIYPLHHRHGPLSALANIYFVSESTLSNAAHSSASVTSNSSSSFLSSLWLSISSWFTPVRKESTVVSTGSRQNGSTASKKSKEHHLNSLQSQQDAIDKEDLEFCEQQNHVGTLTIVLQNPTFNLQCSIGKLSEFAIILIHALHQSTFLHGQRLMTFRIRCSFQVSDYDDSADVETQNFGLSTSNGIIKNVVKPPKKAKSTNVTTSSNSCGTSNTINKDATIARWFDYSDPLYSMSATLHLCILNIAPNFIHTQPLIYPEKILPAQVIKLIDGNN